MTVLEMVLARRAMEEEAGSASAELTEDGTSTEGLRWTSVAAFLRSDRETDAARLLLWLIERGPWGATREDVRREFGETCDSKVKRLSDLCAKLVATYTKRTRKSVESGADNGVYVAALPTIVALYDPSFSALRDEAYRLHNEVLRASWKVVEARNARNEKWAELHSTANARYGLAIAEDALHAMGRDRESRA